MGVGVIVRHGCGGGREVWVWGWYGGRARREAWARGLGVLEVGVEGGV